MEQESRTPDESQIIQQLWRRAYLDTIDDHIRILKEYAETYSRERVEALEKQLSFVNKVAKEQIEKVESLESKLSTLEETLKAAERVVEISSCFGIEYEDKDYKEAIEKYNSLKQKV